MSAMDVEDLEAQNGDDHEEEVEEEEEDDESSEPASQASSKAAAASGAKAKAKTTAKAVSAKKDKASSSKKEKAAGEKKATKRKGDGSDPSPKKAKAAAPDDPKETVKQYMLQQNRPYTALVVYENLHQTIKKPALIKILDELSEEGVLQLKDFKKVRMYLAKQHEGDAADPSELNSLAAEEQSIREKVNTLKSANTRLSEQMRALQNEPSEEDLAALLVKYNKEVESLNQRLARIKGDSKLVSKEGMDKAQHKFNELHKTWAKRKRAARDLMDDMCGEEGKPADVVERFGLETDEDADVKLQDWAPLVKELKKPPVIAKK